MASRSLTFACLIGAVRRRLADERGFTIIEVLVSAVLVVIAGVGTFAAFDSAGAASGRNKERTIALGLAQSDQERVRAKTALQLATLTDASETTPKTVNDTKYTVVSTASWVTDASGTSSCSGMGDEAGFMRITSTVTWANMHTLSPVKVDSIKSVPNGGYRTTRGSLAVKLTNGAAGPVPGVPVTVTGPAGYSTTTNTNASGCLVLGFLPVGTYTVSFSKAGYVQDTLPNAQAVSKTVQVAGEQTASAAFNYDLAGSLAVKFFTRVPLGGADIATTGDGFTVANSGLGAPNTRSFGLLPAAKAAAGTGTGAGTGTSAAAVDPASATPAKVLFPFSGAYGLWAGTCAQNDPSVAANGTWFAGLGNTQSGNAITGIVPSGGAVANLQAFEPMMKVTVNKFTNSGQTTTGAVTVASKVTATPVVTGCAGSYTANTATNGTIADGSQPTMPYGSYTICAQDKTTSPTKRVVKTVNNNVRLGQAVTMTLPFGTTNPAVC